MTDLERLEERVDQLDDDLNRTDSDNPGAVVRIDRLEQMVQTMTKVGGLVVGAGILWKVLEVVGSVIEHRIAQ